MTGFLHGGMLGVVHLGLSVTLVASLIEGKMEGIMKDRKEGKGRRKDRSKVQDDELSCRQYCVCQGNPRDALW